MPLSLQKDVSKKHPLYWSYVHAVSNSDAKLAKELLKDLRKTDKCLSSRSRRNGIKQEMKSQISEMKTQLYEELFYYYLFLEEDILQALEEEFAEHFECDEDY